MTAPSENPFAAPGTPAPAELGPADLQAKLRRQLLSIGELFSIAAWASTQRLTALAIVLVLIYLPLEIVQDWALSEMSNISVTLPLVPVQLALSFLAWAAVAAIAGTTIEGRYPGFFGAAGLIARKFVPVLICGAFFMVLVAVGTVLLVIPAVLFTVWFMFVTHAIVLHEYSIFSAWGHSRRAVEGRWWSVAGKTFLFTMMSAIVNIVGQQLIGALAPAGIAVFLNTAVNVAAIFFAIVMTALYLNLHYVRGR